MTRLAEAPTAAEIDGRIVARNARRTGRGGRVWARVWPPLLGLAIFFAFWEILVLAGWKPAYVLPDPLTVFEELFSLLTTGSTFWQAIGNTLQRGVTGFAIALVIGTLLGVAVSRFTPLRAAIGSLLTGLQTMPSIAWFPFAILLFGVTEQSILFVIVLGAAPSIANGLISGIDDVPPQLTRTAHTLGARGISMYTRVVIPAALPTYIAGLKQGWAFAWRSLMAGELLVIIGSKPALGVQLDTFRSLANAPALIATMVVILILGMVIDGLFSRLANAVRVRRGLGAVRL